MIASILFFALGAICLLLSVVYIWATYWRQVDGVIKEKKITEVKVSSSVLYDTFVKYSYEIDGMIYSSNRKTLLGGRLFSSKESAKKT